jgi:hypothetical protein
MSVRRLDRTAVFFGIALTRLMQPNTSRLAVEVKHQPTVFAQPGLHSSLFRQPVAFSLVPAVLMSDGTMFANFGGGFQPMVRCAGGVVVGQPRVIGSNGIVLREAAPPTYTQSVPAQMSSSYQMLPSVQAQARSTQGVSHPGVQGGCFSQDASGRVFRHRR